VRTELVAAPTVRIPRQPPVSLVNLSTGGVLLEAPFQLRPGSRLTLELLTSAHRLDVPFRLLRCYVSELTRGLRYRAACEFEEALSLPMSPDQSLPAVEPRLLQVLEQFQQVGLASEESVQGTRFGELLGWVVAASRRNEPRALISTRIQAHLRQLFPTLVVGDKSPLPPQDPSTVSQFFDLEFRSKIPLTRSDRRFLRACAQLISLLGRSTAAALSTSEIDPLGLALDIPESDIARTPSDWIEMCRQDGRSL
jgi:hypothetical protein